MDVSYQIQEEFRSGAKPSIGKAAIWLAMSPNRDFEEGIKEKISNQGFICVATEVSGPLDIVQKNIMKNTLSAALSAGVVKHTPTHVHAVSHALLEAIGGVVPINQAPNPSLKIKIAVVSSNQWVAVAAYGWSSFHIINNHERIGLGIMNL